MSVSKDLMNDKLKAEVIRRVFPNGDELGCHKFQLGKDTCSQCSLKFWDWVSEEPDGIHTGMKMCSVIGRDETALFRNEDF